MIIICSLAQMWASQQNDVQSRANWQHVRLHAADLNRMRSTPLGNHEAHGGGGQWGTGDPAATKWKLNKIASQACTWRRFLLKLMGYFILASSCLNFAIVVSYLIRVLVDQTQLTFMSPATSESHVVVLGPLIIRCEDCTIEQVVLIVQGW